MSRYFLRKQTAKVRTLRVAISRSHHYIHFPLLKSRKVRKTWKDPARLKIQKNKSGFNAMNVVAKLKKILGGMWNFSKRIFENFAGINRLSSRKNGFASGSKLRKRSKQCWRKFHNSWYVNSQSNFLEDREQLQLGSSLLFGLYDIFNYLTY